MALEKENDRTTQFNTFSLLSNEVKNCSRCWVWLPRGFLIIKLDTAVWTARSCRNSTSFSLRVQGETGIFKAFARNLMESFYRQRRLLTPRAPSKIVWLAWLLKSRAGDQQNISACKWHLGQNARAQCHERETENPVTSSDKATFQKCFHQVPKALLESGFLEDSIFPGLSSAFLIYWSEFWGAYLLSRDHMGIKQLLCQPMSLRNASLLSIVQTPSSIMDWDSSASKEMEKQQARKRTGFSHLMLGC